MSKEYMSAKWEVPLSDRVHTVWFDHGTTSGSRAIFVNGQCIRRDDFKFKLVGAEHFKIGNTPCTIHITAWDDFSYAYKLTVNGKSLETFTESQGRKLKCWMPYVGGDLVRVVLEKDSLNVCVNGKMAETAGEFTDEGTETHFAIGNHACFIQAVSSGNKRTGIVHTLFVDGEEVPETPVDKCEPELCDFRD